MEDTINAPINYYDSEKRLIIGANLIGKIHPQLMDKLVQPVASKHESPAT